MFIRAAQHIFTNVEKEDSPSRERGFQTLYYSKNLISEEEKLILEEHAYFWAAPKNQFYMPGEKAVITNVVPVRGSDKYGGEGLYISHALILEPEEFLKIENNPLVLVHFYQDCFCNSINTAISRGDSDTGNIDPVEINLPDDTLQKFNKTTVSRLYFRKQEDVGNLAALSVYADEAAKERQSLAVLGESKEIEDFLRFVFYLLPLELRLNCSFDTDYYNPRMRLPYFWCGGFKEDQPPDSGSFILIEKGIIPADELITGKSPYLNWLLECINNRDYQKIQENRQLIYALEKSMEDKMLFSEKIREIPPDILSDFMKQNKSLFAESIRESLIGILGKEAGDKTAPFMTEIMDNRQDELLQAVSGEINLQSVTEAVLEMLSQSSGQVPDDEMLTGLKEIYVKTGNRLLNAFVSFYEEDWRKLKEAVPDLSNEELERFLRQTLANASDDEYFQCVATVENMNTVAEIYYELSSDNPSLSGKLPAIIALLTRLTLKGHIDRFKPLVEKMSPEEKRTMGDKMQSIIKDFVDENSGEELVGSVVNEPVRKTGKGKDRKSGGILDKILPFLKKRE